MAASLLGSGGAVSSACSSSWPFSYAYYGFSSAGFEIS